MADMQPLMAKYPISTPAPIASATSPEGNHGRVVDRVDRERFSLQGS
jgi:hypothetical protein